MPTVPFAESHEFALGQHAGPYRAWPLETPLLKGNVPTGKTVRGYHLTFQFRLARDEYLLVIDWDCPFEKYYEVYLLSETGVVLSHLTTPPMNPLSVAGAPTLLGSWQMVNHQKIRFLSGDAPPHLDVTVRRRADESDPQPKHTSTYTDPTELCQKWGAAAPPAIAPGGDLATQARSRPPRRPRAND